MNEIISESKELKKAKNSSTPTFIQRIQEYIQNTAAGIVFWAALLISGCGDQPKNTENWKKFSARIVKMSHQEKREIFYAPAPSHNIAHYKWKYMDGYFGMRFWPRKVQSPLINPWLHEHGKKYKLIKAKTKKDFDHLPSLEKNPNNSAYRFYKVGEKDDGEKFGHQNDPDYIKMHIAGHKVIKELHQEFANILYKEANLDKNYTPTLTITSIGRDDEYIKKAKILNASPNSAHKYGIAFDLRLSIHIHPNSLTISDTGGSQILTHKNTKEIIELTGNDKIIYELALRQALDKLRTEGKIFINIEWNPPHYHIHVIPQPNTKWIPSDDYFKRYSAYYEHILTQKK